MEPMTRIKAVIAFFEMTNRQAMEEIPAFKKADPDGSQWIWLSDESAKALGVELTN